MPDNNSNFVALCGDEEWDSEDSRNFIEALCSSLQEKFGKDCQIEYKEHMGFNSTRVRGLLIRSGGTRTCQFVRLRPYAKGCRDGQGIEEYADKIFEECRSRLPVLSLLDSEAGAIFSWDSVKDRILPFLIPYEGNEQYLESLVHERKLDLAVGCYIKVEQVDGHVYIKKGLLEAWGISEEELLRQALDNLGKEDYSILGIEKMLEELTGLSLGEIIEPVPMMVMTNHDKYMGAAGILNEGLLKKCSDQINNSMYILPSSIHEMMFVPCQPDIDPQELQKIVYEINRECVAEEERLSDHVYLYDRETADISIAA